MVLLLQLKVKSGGHTKLNFLKKNESERDAFYDKLISTFKAWKTKYVDILNEQ
jgi:hypothetical protein